MDVYVSFYLTNYVFYNKLLKHLYYIILILWKYVITDFIPFIFECFSMFVRITKIQANSSIAIVPCDIKFTTLAYTVGAPRNILIHNKIR